jgi:general stress protein 26
MVVRLMRDLPNRVNSHPHSTSSYIIEKRSKHVMVVHANRFGQTLATLGQTSFVPSSSALTSCRSLGLCRFIAQLSFKLTTIMSSFNPKLDPVTANAENKDVTPQEKIQGLHKIVAAAGTGMLTTRNNDGHLHSRAMVPCSRKYLSRYFLQISSLNNNGIFLLAAFGPTQVNLFFIANNASHKFEEIENDSHVNVSFYDGSTTSWASFTGIAKITQDKALINKYWHSTSASSSFAPCSSLTFSIF